MAQSSFQSRDADIDVGRLFGAIWRDKFTIALGALALTALVVLALMLATPQYRSDARVLIDASESVFTRPEGDDRGNQIQFDPEAVASQVEVITSTDLLMQVADDLGLAALEEFNPAASMSAFGRGLAMLGVISSPSEGTQDERVLNVMRDKLTVFPVENSRVIVIRFASEDAALAARVPNALAEAYVALESRAELINTGAAAEYLAGEIGQLEGEVRIAEGKVADFRAANGLLLGQDDAVLATQQLAELSSELSRVRAERSSLDARVRSVQTALANGTAVDTVPDVIASPVIARLTEQQANLRADMADLSTTLLAGHPRMQALQSQIAGLDAQIRNQAQNVLAGLRNEADIARDRETELNIDLNTLKAASATANESEVELRALEREAASKRALLESYLLRFREAQSRDQGGYAPATARVISRATVPLEPFFPRTVPMAGAAFFIALIIMMLVTLLKELFSGRALVPAVGSASHMEASDTRRPTSADPSVPVGAVPVADPAEPPIARLEPTPVFVKQRDLRGQDVLTQRAPASQAPKLAGENLPPANDNFSIAAVTANIIRRGAGRALVVTPPGGASGASAVALARALDGKGLQVILVDLSGSGEAGLEMAGDPTIPGINDLLASEASYSQVIVGDVKSTAHVIPVGVADTDRALSGIARLPIVLEGLSSAYDVVLVECGMTDAAGLANLVSSDSEIVLALSETTGEAAVETASDLADHGFDDVLIVLDQSDETPGPKTPQRAHMAM